MTTMGELEEQRAELLKRAFNFFFKQLELEEEENCLCKLKVNLVHYSTLPVGTEGICTTAINVKTREITDISVRIKNTSNSWGMVETLAHEMIHVKQNITGDLKHGVRWKKLFGIIPYMPYSYPIYKGIDCDDVPYKDRLFEIEAFTEQSNLTKLFLMDEMRKKDEQEDQSEQDIEVVV